MSKFILVVSAVAVLSAARVTNILAEGHDRTLAVIMTNDPSANQIQVYDAATKTLEQAAVKEPLPVALALDRRRLRQQVGRVGHQCRGNRPVEMRLTAGLVRERVEDAERSRPQA